MFFGYLICHLRESFHYHFDIILPQNQMIHVVKHQMMLMLEVEISQIPQNA